MAEADVDEQEIFAEGSELAENAEMYDDEFGCDDEDDLAKTFNIACERLKTLVHLLTPAQLLEFYGFYKQATVGPCTIPRPSWYAFEAKQKWDAWNTLGDMNQFVAMTKYVELFKTCIPEDDTGDGKQVNTAWVAVSSLANNDDHINDEDKTIFDWVKENDLVKIRQVIRGRDICSKDSDGMGLIHWAADRGSLDVMRFLIDDMNADIEMQDADGQSALHYAASCGHIDVLKYLIDKGANKLVEDNDGTLPKDVASDKEIENILL